MEILSVREHPARAREFISFFQKHWASEKSMMVYEDCILSCLDSPSPLPQWYLLTDGDAIVGGAGGDSITEAAAAGAQALVTGDIEDALLLTGKTGQETLTLIDVIGRAAL